MSDLLHELVRTSAAREPDAAALGAGNDLLDYATLEARIERTARGLTGETGLTRGARVAIWLDKRVPTVIAMFAASRAGGVFVPVNPVLKEEQALHILRDCTASVLVTSVERLARLAPRLAQEAPSVRHVALVDGVPDTGRTDWRELAWDALEDGDAGPLHRHIDVDLAAILYTSGSTGRPKGVVLSHRNMVAGAKSVATYLENTPSDRILALLPLSFDAGLSQLTTAFHAGASVHLHNYLLARDVPRAVERLAITGLGAVPPVWIPLARLDWPAGAAVSMRYFTNTGGRMPRSTLDALRARLPHSMPYLMYGLTEAFRSTYLPPVEVDRRPDSIGKAIPNAEILVVRADGSECDADEPGELVHRGALVAQGYWNDAAKTAERFRPAPGQPAEIVTPELAVWSGDTVRRDAEGFLYFVGRRDEMIKTSGYRVSPTEVEEALYATGLVAEAAAFGVPDEELGQAIAVFVVAADADAFSTDALLGACRTALPGFMVPARVELRSELPRNPNGKIDRTALRGELDAA
jgi:acyl-CoA ligase (AMP-forming) (exosortase A-associated)